MRYFSAVLCVFLFSFPAWSSETSLRASTKIFLERCALCHGADGMGGGLLPIRLSSYPITNLLSQQKNTTKKDLQMVITKGFGNDKISGFMPPWENELSGPEIGALAEFIMALRTDTETIRTYVADELAKRKLTVADGQALFQSRCSLCHGKTGDGKGRMARVITNPPPANLQKSLLPESYLHTIIAEGGQGVGRSGQMPPWKDQFSKKEIGVIINYLMTLRVPAK